MSELFRKRPTTVEAMRIQKPYLRVQEFCPLMRLVKGDRNQIIGAYLGNYGARQRVGVGDWVLKCGDTFELMGDEMFRATFEPAATKEASK